MINKDDINKPAKLLQELQSSMRGVMYTTIFFGNLEIVIR